ncbi:hypothetical protein LNQ03_07300 [Klebsiella pneumoniae subsp. pneumoniae]|nr:hypothetical protein [Klebsiella pneumoniae subsp. pneumoniae]
MQRVCPHSFLHGHALVMRKRASACRATRCAISWRGRLPPCRSGDGARRIVLPAARCSTLFPMGSDQPYRLDFFDDGNRQPAPVRR